VIEMTDLRDRSNQGTDPSEDATRRHDEARIMPDASLRDSARSHSIPEWIGDYRVLGVLGRGGMRVVYVAEQQTPKRVVALKLIRGDASVDDVHVAMFRREVEVLARLAHPMIAGIYESGGTADGQHYFAMELVRGVTLLEYAPARGTARHRRTSAPVKDVRGDRGSGALCAPARRDPPRSEALEPDRRRR
jgi:serine/threonine protein kinase